VRPGAGAGAGDADAGRRADDGVAVGEDAGEHAVGEHVAAVLVGIVGEDVAGRVGRTQTEIGGPGSLWAEQESVVVVAPGSRC